ncbi:MAG: MaoC family dehydratase [Alphaproteobacteria bacterium]|nr:MaoC family dehydratase [Alphaproteobacteria bacterium]
MIDRKFIGMTLPKTSVDVEKGQLRFFAKATGETNPIYFDEAAAKDAGHPALPAPPTFAFSLNLLAPQKVNWLQEMGVNIANILHGEQAFEYFKPIYAGDVITLQSRVADIYDKKGGALEFIVMELDAENQRGELCVRQRMVTVVRNSGAAK